VWLHLSPMHWYQFLITVMLYFEPLFPVFNLTQNGDVVRRGTTGMYVQCNYPSVHVHKCMLCIWRGASTSIISLLSILNRYDFACVIQVLVCVSSNRFHNYYIWELASCLYHCQPLLERLAVHILLYCITYTCTCYHNLYMSIRGNTVIIFTT